jgi:hypothetical protein
MIAARKVGFLVAGVQKGGTSALFEYLRDMPGLQLPDVKEAHFFDDEQKVDWARPDYAPYHALFADDGRRWGEATPIYLYWPNCLERIAAYNPAMKFVLLFRDPIDRAWSHWKMEYAKRKESEPFQWCIREGRSRLTPGDPDAPGHHRVFSYVERGFYGAQVARLLSLFPAEQCLFLRSEDLRDDPHAALRRISTFLDQSDPPAVEPRIVHPARRQNYPSQLQPDDIRLLAQLYAPDMIEFSNLTGIDPTGWTAGWDLDNSR